MVLEEEVSLLEQNGARAMHFDVMDGHFVPPLTVGASFVKAIRTTLLKDVHLMIQEPLDKVQDYATAGADMITVHIESTSHVHRVLQKIHELKNANDPERGIARGIALNPGTPVSVLEPLLDDVDIIFLLAVNPGFSGQKFIGATVERFGEVRTMVRRAGKDILLGIDGGVTRGNINEIAALGPDIVVSGSAIFDGKAAEENLQAMLGALASFRGRYLVKPVPDTEGW